MGTHRLKCSRANTCHLKQPVERGERAMFTAMVNNSTRHDVPQPGKLGHFGLSGHVDVDGETLVTGRCRIVVDQSAREAPDGNKPNGRRGEADGHTESDQRLDPGGQQRSESIGRFHRCRALE